MLALRPVSEQDIPQISVLWFACFPDFSPLIPDTPATRAWWDDTNLHGLLHNLSQHYVKVVDTTNDRLVAYAKWDFATRGEAGDRFPAWHEDMNEEGCRVFFGGLESERERLFGGKKNYYLDMLATHPDYRGRGAGSMLVGWGCEVADRDGVPLYVDASADGKKLYEKFGFKDLSGPGCAERGCFSMVRTKGHR